MFAVDIQCPFLSPYLQHDVKSCFPDLPLRLSTEAVQLLVDAVPELAKDARCLIEASRNGMLSEWDVLLVYTVVIVLLSQDYHRLM